MKTWLLSAFILSSAVVRAQLISGKVTNEAGKPLGDVSVYVDGTTSASKSLADGNFNIGVPQSRTGNLVFQKEGYKSTFYNLSSIKELPLKVILTRESLIEEVKLIPYTDKNYQTYINRFLHDFLGGSSEEVSIKNPKDLTFAFDKESKTLYAKAKKTLHIVNKHLGYNVDYDLINFSSNYESRLLMYSGTQFFSKMNGSKKQNLEWEKNRLNAYYGSSLHFFRSAYKSKTKEAGFLVNRGVWKKNPKYPTDDEMDQLESYIREGFKKKVISALPPNLADIQNRSRKEKKLLLDLKEQNIPVENFISHENGSTQYAFDDLMVLVYKKAAFYVENQKIVKSKGTEQKVAIVSTNGNKFTINPDGSYDNPNEMTFEDFWDKENVSVLLPLDYQPTQ